MKLLDTGFAKLNLALHVRQRRADGYHELETIFAFTEAGDDVAVEPADGLTLSVDGPFAGAVPAGGDNLVLRAATAFRDALGGKRGAAICLTKRLPVAAGLGGGSADAAAVLRLLNRLWNAGWSPEQLAALGATLGADVAACVHSRTMFGRGRGELLTPVDDSEFAGRPLLLVNPGAAVPTGPVFAGWDGVDRGPLDPKDVAAGRNDLEPPALAIAPVIGTVLAALSDRGADLVRMSGSGATCFALFGDVAAMEAAAADIAVAHPEWWVMPTRIRPR